MEILGLLRPVSRGEADMNTSPIKHVMVKSFCLATATTFLLFVGLGCPSDTRKEPEPGKVTLLFTADHSPEVDKTSEVGEVDLSEILSLRVTLNEVVLISSSDGTEIGVFAGAVDVDLMDLIGISELIATADVPEGLYSEVELLISDPRLVLAEAPGLVITDVLLPEDGRLSVSVDLDIVSGGEQLLVLNLGGINLFDLGDGGFSLTPDFQVHLDQDIATTRTIGIIDDLNSELGAFELIHDEAELVVDYTAATIFLPTDYDQPTGIEQDLEEHARAFVSGTLDASGTLTAELIVIMEYEVDGSDGDTDTYGDSDSDTDTDGDDGTDDGGDDGLPDSELGRYVGVIDDLGLVTNGQEAFRLVVTDLATGQNVPGGTASRLLVLYSEALVFLPQDGEEPTGSKEDLANGQTVAVRGTLSSNGTVHAETIRIFETPEQRFVGYIDDLGLVVDGEDAFRLALTEYATIASGTSTDPTNAARLLVLYTGAEIFLPGDGDEPTGTKEDLANGQRVEVGGVWNSDGSVEAGTIRILPPQELDLTGIIQELGVETDAGDAFWLVADPWLPYAGADAAGQSMPSIAWLVLYGEAVIFLPDDGEEPTGTKEDMANGQRVEVHGVRNADGSIAADAIRLLPPPEVTVVGLVDDLGVVVDGEEAFRLAVDWTFPLPMTNSGFDWDNYARPLVLYTDAAIFLAEDGDEPTGTKEDLANGQRVEVHGLRNPDGSITASTIRILNQPEPLKYVGIVDDLGITASGQEAFRLQMNDSSTGTNAGLRLLVLFTNAEIILRINGERVPGTKDDLANGQTVVVHGELSEDNVLSATKIIIRDFNDGTGDDPSNPGEDPDEPGNDTGDDQSDPGEDPSEPDGDTSTGENGL